MTALATAFALSVVAFACMNETVGSLIRSHEAGRDGDDGRKLKQITRASRFQIASMTSMVASWVVFFGALIVEVVNR